MEKKLCRKYFSFKVYINNKRVLKVSGNLELPVNFNEFLKISIELFLCSFLNFVLQKYQRFFEFINKKTSQAQNPKFLATRCSVVPRMWLLEYVFWIWVRIPWMTNYFFSFFLFFSWNSEKIKQYMNIYYKIKENINKFWQNSLKKLFKNGTNKNIICEPYKC